MQIHVMYNAWCIMSACLSIYLITAHISAPLLIIEYNSLFKGMFRIRDSGSDSSERLLIFELSSQLNRPSLWYPRGNVLIGWTFLWLGTCHCLIPSEKVLCVPIAARFDSEHKEYSTRNTIIYSANDFTRMPKK